MSVACSSELSRLRPGERRALAVSPRPARPAPAERQETTGDIAAVIADLVIPERETCPGVTYPPRSVGRMADRVPPSDLPDVGTRVELPDGSRGVVRHYECYSEHQCTFPVQVGAMTTTWVLSAVKVIAP